MYVTPHPLLARYTLAEHLWNEKKSVFVNGRSRAAIMEDMNRRITRGDFEAEKTEAINVLSTLSLSLSSTSPHSYPSHLPYLLTIIISSLMPV